MRVFGFQVEVVPPWIARIIQGGLPRDSIEGRMGICRPRPRASSTSGRTRRSNGVKITSGNSLLFLLGE